MALFFDQKWFNERLADSGLKNADLARALGLNDTQLAELWKDQREISDGEIGTMALLLGVTEGEVRKRCGVQGSAEARAAMRARRDGVVPAASLDEVDDDRLGRIEAKLDQILALLKAR